MFVPLLHRKKWFVKDYVKDTRLAAIPKILIVTRKHHPSAHLMNFLISALASLTYFITKFLTKSSACPGVNSTSSSMW